MTLNIVSLAVLFVAVSASPLAKGGFGGIAKGVAKGAAKGAAAGADAAINGDGTNSIAGDIIDWIQSDKESPKNVEGKPFHVRPSDEFSF